MRNVTGSKWLVGAFSAVVFRFVGRRRSRRSLHTDKPGRRPITLKASFPLPVAEFPPFERAHAGGVVRYPDTEAESR